MFSPVAILLIFIELYEWTIVAYAVASWFQSSGGVARRIYELLATVCEPFVGIVRRFLPAQLAGGSGLDLAPLGAMLLLILLRNAIAMVLR